MISDIDAERVLDLICGHMDGDWNDGIEAYVNASNDGDTMYLEVDDGEGNKRKFELTIEQVNSFHNN